MPMPNNALAGFIHCRLDPFSSTGSLGIPDTSNVRRIVVDHKGYCDLTLGASGTMWLRTLPTPNMPLIVQGATGDTIRVDGLPIIQVGTASDQRFGWVPGIINSEWSSWNLGGPGNVAGAQPTVLPTPFASSKFRIVTQGFRIWYTGAASACSGVLTVTADSLAIDEDAEHLDFASGFENYDTSGTRTLINQPAGTQNYRAVRLSATGTGDLPSTQMARPDAGALCLIKHISPTYEWVPINGVPQMFYAANFTSGGNPISLVGTRATKGYGTFPGIDAGWESVFLSITGAQAGATYRVECITCVEYEPQQDSAVARFSKLPAQTNDAVVKAVDAVAKTIPSYLPVSANMSPWVRMAINAAAVAAPIIGSGVGGPIGGAIGGAVGAIGRAVLQ